MRAASFRMTRRAAPALAAALALAPMTGHTPAPDPAAAAAATTVTAAATPPSPLVVAAKQRSRVFRDGDGREVTLRGFNVSGSTKLYENSLLPFRSTADAVRSAQAMRDLTGANVIRFLISWEGVQPSPSTIDHAYLDRAVEQIRAFTGRGIRVLVDYHQDLYSSHLFDQGSWYTGDARRNGWSRPAVTRRSPAASASCGGRTCRPTRPSAGPPGTSGGTGGSARPRARSASRRPSCGRRRPR
ncbi:cellulase family glycosylhydrolase [Planomonospora algeriensis]